MNIVDLWTRRRRTNRFRQEAASVEARIIRALLPVSHDVPAPLFWAAMGHAFVDGVRDAIALGVLTESDRDYIVQTITTLMQRETA